MPEETLCSLGKNPKIFSYIIEEKNIYVKIILKLSDDIDNLTLKTFFNKLYSMKLDAGYTNSFAAKYSTRDLINCFKEILEEDNVVSLKKLYEILNKKIEYNWLPVEYAIKEFFAMFEVLEQESYPIREYSTNMKQYEKNLSFEKRENILAKEINCIKENSYMIKLASTKQRQKTKVRQIAQ